MIRLAAIASLAALSGCGSGGPNPIIAAVVGELRGLAPGEEPAAERPPADPVTRADIVAADVAAIRARLEADPVPTIMYAASANPPYVTYVSNFRQSVTLRGAQITGTRGLGTDLLSATSGAPDPLAQAIPLAAWPAGVRRSYEFPANAPQGQIETYDCRFEEFGDPRAMTILGATFTGVEVAEICTGPAGSFENLHFADLQSGFVWRSLQWVGDEVGIVDLEILEPFTGN